MFSWVTPQHVAYTLAGLLLVLGFAMAIAAPLYEWAERHGIRL